MVITAAAVAAAVPVPSGVSAVLITGVIVWVCVNKCACALCKRASETETKKEKARERNRQRKRERERERDVPATRDLRMHINFRKNLASSLQHSLISLRLSPADDEDETYLLS